VDGPAGETRADEGEGGDLALAVMLTTLAGFVDAAAFIRFNGLFVSFMSGNSTQLAALPSEGRWEEAAEALGLVVLFVMGAFAGRLVAGAAGPRRRPVLLVAVAALLVLAAVCVGWNAGPGPAAVSGAAMALAMGMQNAVIQHVGRARASATYVTGVLVSLGQALADTASGAPAPWLVYLLQWLGLVAGAALGALATTRLGPHALLIPATAAALLALVLGALVRRPPASGSSS
jgi:uncharacterized membrane protein YoaK (UPF0700 family)